MRLSTKLSLILTSILAIMFVGYGYLSLRRQKQFFQQDMQKDGQVIGHTVAKAASNLWRTEGVDRASAFVDQINEDYENLLIRFVWLNGSNDPKFLPSIALAPSEQEQLLKKPLVLIRTDGPEPDYLYTFVTIKGPDASPAAALEVRNSFAPARIFVRISALRLGAFFGMIIVSMAGVIWLLGRLFVANPITQLTEKARRIASGDYTGRAEVKGRGEIAALASDINSMSDKLLETRGLLERETNERIKAIEQLRHADRLTTIGTLASGLAHELGTPLNVLSGYLQMSLAKPTADSAERDQAKLSLEQTEKMTRIVRQLLDFSRLRTPVKGPVDVGAIAKQVIATLSPFALKRHTSLKYTSKDESAVAHVDPTQVEQVITNLLLNAIQSNSNGGEIVIGLDKKVDSHPDRKEAAAREHVHLWVMDSGAGIAPEDAERMFDPFFTTKDVGEGTGMGLSIAYGIVKEHSGWIEVETEPGHGSCFSVYLPCEGSAQ